MNAFLTAIATVALSGVVAAVVSHRLQLAAKRADLLREKLEEAWMATDAYCNSLGMHYFRQSALLRGEIDANEANDLTIKFGSGQDPTPFRRLDMLLQLYIPSASPPFKQLLTLRDEMNTILREHRRRYGAGPAMDAELFRKLNQDLPRLDELEVVIKDAIARETRKVVG